MRMAIRSLWVVRHGIRKASCRRFITRPMAWFRRSVMFIGCGQLLMFGELRNAILVDLLPELLPPALGEDEGSQAEDDLRPLGGPAHSRAAQPLFDQCFARRLGHT